MVNHENTKRTHLLGREDRGSRRTIEILVGGIVILLATLVVYGPALPGDVLWDDDQYITENRLLSINGGLWRIWTESSESPQYYPLVFTSFWLEARLWGLSTFGVHLVNVLLHALNALLLWAILRRLHVPGAWLAGALFALHPVNVESVAWMTERKNVLSGTFFLLSILAYLRFMDRRGRPTYGLSLLLFVCALLSKTATCSLPVVLLLVQWWKRPRTMRSEARALLPFFGVGVVFGLATVLIERYEVGAGGEEWGLSWLDRFLLANRALWFYVCKLVWPANLAFNYPRWQIDATAAWQYAFPMLTLAAAALLWRFRTRIGRAPLAALGCFVAGIAPVLGLFNIYYFRYAYVADHFQYHASMSFIALIAGASTVFLLRLAGTRHGARRVLTQTALVVAVTYGLLSFRQAALYTDIDTLWRRTIRQNPSSWLARYNLALRLVADNEQDDQAVREATGHLHHVLRINPRCTDAHVSLGIIAARRGRHDDAMAHYHSALDIDPAHPKALYNMALELYRSGDVDAASAALWACLDSDPTFPHAHNTLGRILLERGDRRGAEQHFHLALSADPTNAPAFHSFGMLYEGDGRYADAIESYARALAIDPAMTESWFRIAVCARAVGDLAAAEVAYRRALRLDPDYTDALIDLAGIAYDTGRFQEAVEMYRRALDLGPDNRQCRENLAWAYHQLSDDARAVAALEEGLRIHPGNLSLMHHLARVLATSPNESVRDGARAVELAKQVVGRFDSPRPEPFGTLAAALAEVQAYEEAVEAARRGVELARSLGMTVVAERLARDLEDYQRRAGQPAGP